MTSPSNTPTQENAGKKFDFDLAVSFAGEDRTLVASIVDKCKKKGYTVFYDADEVASMWGEDLTEYFANTYENRARAALMFVSEHYARKPWTTHERRSILVRALEQGPTGDGPYLLPIRIDDTKLPGVRDSIAFIDSRHYTLDEIANFVEKKLGAPIKGSSESLKGSSESLNRTPRTPEACGVLLSERPPLWEYYYTAFLFVEAVHERQARIRGVKNGFFSPGKFIDIQEIPQCVAEELAHLLSISNTFENLLSGPAQTEA